MGNTEGSEKQSDAQFQGYISQLHYMRKEHSPNIGRDIDLYRDLNPQFPEELVLMYEITFDEDQDSENEVEKLERFKKEVNKRKYLDSLYLSQMLFVNYKVLNGLCLNKVMCRISFQYSEQNLAKIINQSKVSRGSQLQNQFVPEQLIMSFLQQMSDALLCLNNNGEVHGFIMPENILVFKKNDPNPVFKLLDVSILSRYHDCLDRMSFESDYFAPVDPSLLQSLISHSPVSYQATHDIWSLGITTLCYIFNEDFNVFYDWNQKQVRQQKIEQFLSIMNKVNYSQNLIQLVNSMFQPEFQRIDADTIYNKSFKQIIQLEINEKKIGIEQEFLPDSRQVLLQL